MDRSIDGQMDRWIDGQIDQNRIEQNRIEYRIQNIEYRIQNIEYRRGQKRIEQNRIGQNRIGQNRIGQIDRCIDRYHPFSHSFWSVWPKKSLSVVLTYLALEQQEPGTLKLKSQMEIPSGNLTQLLKDPPCLMGKSTISMAMFNSYVNHCQRVNLHFPMVFLWFSYDGFPMVCLFTRGYHLFISQPMIIPQKHRSPRSSSPHVKRKTCPAHRGEPGFGVDLPGVRSKMIEKWMGNADFTWEKQGKRWRNSL